MPIRTTYAEKDGRIVMIQQRCDVDEYMRLGDAAFDDKPAEVIEDDPRFPLFAGNKPAA